MAARVVFLSQVVPYPLDAGPKTRAYHMLSWLCARFETDLVTFVREDDTPEALAHLRERCASVTTVPMPRGAFRDARHLAVALARGRSFLIERDSSARMRRALEDVMSRGGVAAVHADQLWMAQYGRLPDTPLRVLDNHNAVYRIVERLAEGESRTLLRLILRREAGKVGRYEASQVGVFDHTFYVSEADRAAVSDISTGSERKVMDARTTVLPICVDASGTIPIARDADAHRITVLGTMFWPPNVEGVLWLAKEVMPRVMERSAGRRPVLTIIGKRPPASVTALAEELGPAIEITGYVPELARHLEETALFVVPLLSGGGMRVKILDAWAWGLPVLSTTVGAEGVAVTPGVDARIADGPEQFADAIVELLNDRAAADGLAEAGRRAALRLYDVQQVYDPALSAVYGSLAAD